MNYSTPAAAALAGLLVWSVGAMAQAVPPGNPHLPLLAEMFGGVTAGIESCNMDGSAGPKKDQQRDQFVQMGGTAEQFETGFQAGYDRARGRYEAASVSDRKTMCAELEKLLSAQQ